MGMDVYGKKPKSKRGKYFSNNCWAWRPLWDYCCMIMPTMDNEKGHYNDGYGLDEDGALELANRLDTEVKAGRTKMYEDEYKSAQTTAPDIVCWLCKGTGKRKDNVVVENGCNACKGTGKQRPNICHYPFSEENVKNFIEFLNDCGGFKIC